MVNSKANTQIIDDILSVVKAVANVSDVKLELSQIENNFFSWNQNCINNKTIFLPQYSDIAKSRAAVDLAVCYLRFHNNQIHQEFSSNCQSNQQEIFDAFEKIRVISNVKNLYRGVAKNILQKISHDSQSHDILSSTVSHNFPLMLLQEIFADENFSDNQKNSEILNATISGKLLNSQTSQNLQTSIFKNFQVSQNSQKVDKKILSHIKKLAKNVDNQRAFAQEVERFLEFLKQQQEAQEKQNNSQNKSEDSELNKDSASEDASQNQENVESITDSQSGEEEKNSEEQLAKEEKKSFTGEKGESLPMRLQSEASSFDEDSIEFKKVYKVYTNKFDEIISPQRLISKNELQLLRDGLDLRLVKLESVSKKLTIKLKKKLLAKKNSFVEQNQIDGILNRKKFTQLIIDPFSDNHFIAQKQREYQDTVVSILLDNSGSMRGQPILMAVLACEIIATILEKFGVKTEILGFTTIDWKGGKSRKIWEAQGKIKNPGRLSDLRHIIYKSANQNFKKSRINLGLMLREGILKENIDGEALLWAKGRLMQRDEKRKILAVISDGTPVDDSTNSTNDHDILIDHLHHVIHCIEKQTPIEIFGIGIGHQVGNFYRNSIAIKTPQELGDVMIEKITKLI